MAPGAAAALSLLVILRKQNGSGGPPAAIRLHMASRCRSYDELPAGVRCEFRTRTTRHSSTSRSPFAPYIAPNTQHITEHQTMNATKTLKALLIGALLSSTAAFADSAIEVAVVAGTQQARFSIGDSRCVLVNEVIQCSPVLVASN
jgi:hypothetical protein